MYEILQNFQKKKKKVLGPLPFCVCGHVIGAPSNVLIQMPEITENLKINLFVLFLSPVIESAGRFQGNLFSRHFQFNITWRITWLVALESLGTKYQVT